MRSKCDLCQREFEEEDLIDKQVLYFCRSCERERQRKITEIIKDGN
jgi:hypothetical protein